MLTTTSETRVAVGVKSGVISVFDLSSLLSLSLLSSLLVILDESSSSGGGGGGDGRTSKLLSSSLSSSSSGTDSGALI